MVVIGTSADGLEALDALIGQLPEDLPAAIFVVQHMSAENNGQALLSRLERRLAFRCKPATGNASSPAASKEQKKGSWGQRYYSDRARETGANIKRLREMVLAPRAA